MTFIMGLLELLYREGFLDEEGMKAATHAAERTGGDRLVSVLLRQGLISEERLLEALARFHGVDLWPPNQLAVLVHAAQTACAPNGLTEAMARRLEFVLAQPLPGLGDVDKGLLLIGRDVCRSEIEDWLTAHDLRDRIARRYLLAGRDLERVLGETYSSPDKGSIGKKTLQQLAEDAPIIELVNGVLARATDSRASDIHVEPDTQGFSIRYRVDGLLSPPERYARDRFDAVVSRLKLIAGLDIAERRLPQDGRFSAKMAGVETDVRVSVIPAVLGESLVLRLLPNTKGTRFELSRLGMESDHFEMYRSWMSHPDGIVLVTGPTGSGKSTTLYATLSALDVQHERIMTVEDPVEYQVEGITQFQVHSDIGFDFAAALRAMLRHDPDTIMVGEIRDVETARIAVQCSLTGHRVFSTLHTNDSATAFLRLADMGVEPFLIAATVRGVVAQRLVRRLCACAVPLQRKQLPPAIAEWQEENAPAHGNWLWKAPCGCSHCQGTGYKGRIAVYELLPASQALSQALIQSSGIDALRRALPPGFRTLRDDALFKAMRGETSIAEALSLGGLDKHGASLPRQALVPSE